MNPIISIRSNIESAYAQYSFWGKIRDRFQIRFQENNYIKELDLEVIHMKVPPNFDARAHENNINIAQRYVDKEVVLAPKTYRRLDYIWLNNFQRDLMGFSVMKSIQLALRLRKKSIKNSCIVIYDANDNINSNIIFQLAKEAKYIILLSDNLRKSNLLREYIIANYGIAPMVTNDIYFALQDAEFIVTSKKIEMLGKAPVWYLDNLCFSDEKRLTINDVEYATPWGREPMHMSLELLGAILSQMEEKDVEKSLKYNGIILDRIKFNESVIDKI